MRLRLDSDVACGTSLLTEEAMDREAEESSIDGRASIEEAKATKGGKPKGWASVEEAEAQASKEEAKGQAYQDKKTENCLYAVVVGELEERSKP